MVLPVVPLAVEYHIHYLKEVFKECLDFFILYSSILFFFLTLVLAFPPPFFFAAPTVYGSSQVRERIPATSGTYTTAVATLDP